jgi:hypothetical protein
MYNTEIDFIITKNLYCWERDGYGYWNFGLFTCTRLDEEVSGYCCYLMTEDC